MGTCGIAAGAEAVLAALKDELTKNKLEAEIIQVGCIGFCYAEPIVEIAKSGKPSIFYGDLTPELMAEIVRDYLVK